MTTDELNQLLAKGNVSIAPPNPGLRKPRETVLFANPAGPVAKLESDSRDASLGACKIQERAGERFLVRIKSFRRRLLDEDNLCEKYACDLLRYSGIIPDDSAAKAKIEVSQEKIPAKDVERVEITVSTLI